MKYESGFTWGWWYGKTKDSSRSWSDMGRYFTDAPHEEDLVMEVNLP
jgi:hypothetical protein